MTTEGKIISVTRPKLLMLAQLPFLEEVKNRAAAYATDTGINK